MRPILPCILLLLLIFSGPPLTADIFFWTDDDGIRHYANTSPPGAGDFKQMTEEQSLAVADTLSRDETRGQQFKVLKIYDGDTILAGGLGLRFKIRMAGIDAPENGYRNQPGQPFSKKSTEFLKKLLHGNPITLKSHGIGGYNRQLAEIFCQGKNINLEMVRAGLAEVYRGRRPDKLDSALYLKAETTARSRRQGMWIQGNAYKSPRQWRKEHPRK